MALLTGTSSSSRPHFRTTLSSLIAFAAKLPLARRHQRASSALLLVIIVFTIFTFLSNSSPTGRALSYASTGKTFIRPTYDTKRRRSLEPNDRLGVEAYKYLNADQRATRVRFENSLKTRPPPAPFIMSPDEELAAVIYFITALPSNAITDVDPDTQIPAELLLGFNTRSGDRARAELDDVVQNTWFEHPVVIFSEIHSPRAREIKQIIATYKLLPVPVVFEVDERSDTEILTKVLYRLTGANSLPILLIGGRPAGSVEDITAAHESGALKLDLAAAGAVIGGSEKKKKKKMKIQFTDE